MLKSGWPRDGIDERSMTEDRQARGPKDPHCNCVGRSPDGTGLRRLTFNNEEERGPAWSPDGTRIAYACRIGGEHATFEICVMNADGSNIQRLTSNTVPDLTPTWSPDGTQLIFHRQVPGQGFQLFTINASLNPDGTRPSAIQLTTPPGINIFAHWGDLRTNGGDTP